MQKHMLGRSFWMQMMADKKLAADVDAYKRSHGGVSPPVPLSHKLKRAVCCTSRLDPYRDSSLLLIPVSRVVAAGRGCGSWLAAALRSCVSATALSHPALLCVGIVAGGHRHHGWHQPPFPKPVAGAGNRA